MGVIALVRDLDASIANCELTHLDRETIDVDRARIQHHALAETLRTCGAQVITLPALEGSPDAVFVEDTAVVLKEIAIMTRPGAVSRQSEVESVSEVLRRYRDLVWIDRGATLDGGDVMVDGRTIYVGISQRTTVDAANQLSEIVGRYGYRVVRVAVAGCLHLKTAVTAVAEGVFLGNFDWFDADALEGERIAVDPSEPFGANSCRVGNALIYPEEHVKTASFLRSLGLDLRPVATSELAKAEAGVSCCSLLIS